MSFFGNLFGKKKSKTINPVLDWIGMDMHNHLLPAIDDGSQSIEQSIALIEGLGELGIKNFVCTPHVMEDVHMNTPITIQSAYENLNTALLERGIDVKINYSAEYMIDNNFDQVIQNNQICALPDNHVLIEMSYLSESKALFQTILDLQNKGLKPILAHPERYNYYHQNFDMYKQIKDAGCSLQLNLLSISRYYGQHVKTTALTLIKSGMYDFVGTDTHHEKHMNALQDISCKYDVRDLLKTCKIRNQELL